MEKARGCIRSDSSYFHCRKRFFHTRSACQTFSVVKKQRLSIYNDARSAHLKKAQMSGMKKSATREFGISVKCSIF